MTELTKRHLKVRDHIHYSKGTKTVCVSTCLNFLGIAPDQYAYTSSARTIHSYESVIRRFGYSLRSRASAFKIKKGISTMTQLRMAMRKSEYTANDYFVVSGVQRTKAHLMILNGQGEIVIDTAPGRKWRVRSVKQVFKQD